MESNELSSSDNLKINAEGPIEKVHQEFPYGGNKMAEKILTLGAGFDNQNHVTRPRTAQIFKQTSNTLKRVTSQLETITEKGNNEEDAVAMSQGL